MRRQLVALEPSFTVIHTLLVGIAGLILPVLLIPLVSLTGYSVVVEELAKAIVVIVCILPEQDKRNQLGIAVLFGALFGLSESCLYLNQILQFGDASVFWHRLVWTVPMHILTIVVILLPTFLNKKMVILGFGMAILLHLAFNSFAITL